MSSRSLLYGLALSLACVSPAAAQAADGVVLVQTITSGGETTTSQVQLEPNRIRTEVGGSSGSRQVIIFDGTREVLTIVDTANRSYTEMTRADAERMGGMMQGAMAMMQEQMAKMPPEQRKAMEEKMGAMMGAMGGGAPVARPEYKRVGSDQVGQWACERYDAFTNGEKTAELCTVDPQVLGFSMSDFSVLGKMTEFVRSMVPQLANQFVGLGTPEQGFDGLPVRTVTTAGGTTTTVVLTEARRETFADDLFEVPAGFDRRAMPNMNGVGR